MRRTRKTRFSRLNRLIRFLFSVGSVLAVALQPIDANPLELFTMQYMTVDRGPVRNLLKNTVPPMHRRIYTALNNRDLMRLSIEAGRGSAKSTLGSVIFPLYEICTGDYDEIQTFSRTGGTNGLSAKWLKIIKNHLTHNPLIVHDFGIRRGDVWGQEHVQVIRGDGKTIDVYCRGKHASARGARGLCIIDDPQNTADVRSETVLEADEEWLFSDVLPIMLPGQRLIFIGTSISPISLLAKVQQLPEPWMHLKCPIEVAGRTQWPEQFPQEYLDQQKADMGLERFRAEYCCEPRVPGNPIFNPDWFKTYESDSQQFNRLRLDGFYIVTGFDGAESKADSADYTAIVTVGVTHGARPDIYVLECKRGHWTTKEGAEQLFLTFDRFKQHKSVVESRCAPPNKDAIIEEIEERQRIYSKYINLYQVKPTRDKVTRAHQVQSLFQEGRVYFDKMDKGQQSLISELTLFTGSQNYHDDQVDALVYALSDVKHTTRNRDTKVMESAIADTW